MRRREMGTRRRIVMSGVLTRARREDGAILPIMAVLLAGLIVASLYGANAASMYGLKKEEQRAADLSALAAAANIPLTNLFSTAEPQTTACNQADRLLTRANSPLANDLSTTRSGPTCTSGITVEGLFDWSVIQRVRDALNSLVGPIRTLNLCGPLRGLLDPFLATLGNLDCSNMQQALTGMPDNLSPAVFTPKVRVTIRDAAEAPVPLPQFAGSRSITAQAKARRRFKNVVVVPAVHTSDLTGLPSPVGDLLSGAPMPFNELNLNQSLATVRNQLIPLLYQANTSLAGALNPYLAPAGLTFDISGLILDVQDLYNPPTTATPPSPLQVAQEAIRTGQPVLILRLFKMPILGIPALDFTGAYLTPLADGNFRATPIPLSDLTRANGLFGATLVP